MSSTGIEDINIESGHWQSSFGVVLVEPEDSLNIGSVARVMTNLGFDDLTLIDTPDYQSDKANATACWGAPLLERASFKSGYHNGISDFSDVIGFSSSHWKDRADHILLPDWIEQLKTGVNGRVALVFGPERTGLRKEHLNQCRKLVKIPSTAENPSFNLAQAVLIVLYELSRQHWKEIQRKPLADSPGWNEFQQLDRQLTELMTVSGFNREGTPAGVPEMVLGMMKRIEPDKREMGILLGFFSRLLKTLERSGS